MAITCSQIETKLREKLQAIHVVCTILRYKSNAFYRKLKIYLVGVVKVLK